MFLLRRFFCETFVFYNAHLHSNMFLLRRGGRRSVAGTAHLHSNMFLLRLTLKNAAALSVSDLHSNMFLLRHVLHKRHLLSLSFTFQYVSIKTNYRQRFLI